MNEAVWFPSEAYTRGSHLERLMRALEVPDYDGLYRLSIEQRERFWMQTLDQLGFEWFTPYEAVADESQGRPWTRWFVGGRLNLVHNALARHLPARDDQVALIWEGEDGARVRYTYRQLAAVTAQAAAALRQLGVARGDRVGILLPMIPEAVIAALASAWIGAIFTPIFSGYGAEAVATRLRDAEAKILVTADGYYRRGKVVPLKPTADQAADLAPTVEHILVARRLGLDVAMSAPRDLAWDAIVPAQAADLPIAVMDSMEPFMILHTSGTTGRPKGTVHYHAGFPVKASQDLAQLFDLREREVLFWFTDLGWMMGPWAIIGGLSLGATVVLYEGAPDFPGPDRVWSLVENHRITHLGISPTLVRSLMAHGSVPVESHDLGSLRVLGSTGEPWNAESYQWFFNTVGRGRLPIINYSGGTEVSGGILGCTTFRPIRVTGFNTPAPGIDVAVLDADGHPVVGKVGELAVLNSWPGMTHGFWHDADRYLEAYWSRFPDVWIHGDLAMVDNEGHWFIVGRSDDTLKVAGKRVGPAEVESIAMTHPAVKEAAAIGVPHAVKGEVIVLVVVPHPEVEATPALADEIVDRVVTALGKPMKPERVLFAPDLPKTRSSKIMRRALRAAYLGQDPGDLTMLENPAALEAVRGKV